MSSFKINQKSDGDYLIEGELTFFSLNKKIIKSFDFLNKEHSATLDLAQVNSADSAGLALIIELIKNSQQHNTQLTIKNMPQQLITLANISDLDIEKI